MNIWDILILILVFAAVACAVIHIVRVVKRGGNLCGGDCLNCTASCAGRSASERKADKK